MGGMMGMMGMGHRAPATPGDHSFDMDMNPPPTPNSAGLRDSSSSLGGSNMDSMESWVTTDIEVRIRSDSFRGGQFYNSVGVVREVGDTSSKVKILSKADGDTISVPHEFLEPVTPAKKDKIKIIRGEFKGHTGSLIGIDGSDGIVKMEINLDIKILRLDFLAKLYVP